MRRFVGRVGRRIRTAFWFAHGGYAFYVKFLVARVANHSVYFEAFNQQDADANVNFCVRRQPYLVVGKRLLKNEARSFLQIRQHTAG